jgi:hypothetical protein
MTQSTRKYAIATANINLSIMLRSFNPPDKTKYVLDIRTSQKMSAIWSTFETVFQTVVPPKLNTVLNTVTPPLSTLL